MHRELLTQGLSSQKSLVTQEGLSVLDKMIEAVRQADQLIDRDDFRALVDSTLKDGSGAAEGKAAKPTVAALMGVFERACSSPGDLCCVKV